jgi:predicted extracellular nuclease
MTETIQTDPQYQKTNNQKVNRSNRYDNRERLKEFCNRISTQSEKIKLPSCKTIKTGPILQELPKIIVGPYKMLIIKKGNNPSSFRLYVNGKQTISYVTLPGETVELLKQYGLTHDDQTIIQTAIALKRI